MSRGRTPPPADAGHASRDATRAVPLPRLLSTTTYVDDTLLIFTDAAYDTAPGGRGPVGAILWLTAETAAAPPSAEAAATAEDGTTGRERT